MLGAPTASTVPVSRRTHAAPELPRFLRPIIGYLRAHPIVVLALLTPGIPEYLSSSSSLNGLFVAPPVFLLFLGLNLGMYVPGALLVREAMLRWRKGWASVIALGGAYAIVEEGLGLSTMFNPHASVVGVLGYYGHWLGVNWVWIPGVLMVHAVYSISLPILLFGYALPEWRERSLVGPRGRWAVATVLATDIAVLFAFNYFGLHFFMGVPVLLGAFAAIAVLVLVARWLPARLLGPRTDTRPPVVWRFALLGALLFPGTVLIEGLLGTFGVPAGIAFVALLTFYAILLSAAYTWVRITRVDAQALAFAAGALAPIAFLGLVGSFPSTIFASAATAYLIYRLWKSYGTEPAEVPALRALTWAAGPGP